MSTTLEEQSFALRDLVVITGFSGAGKSTAMAAFEDEGYFCVDNLPSEMIGSLVELFAHSGSKVAYAAVVSDLRAGSYFEGLAEVLDRLEMLGVHHRVVFLEASEESLQTRYKETRRRHPLSPDGSVAAGIARERVGACAAAPARGLRARHDRHDGSPTAAQARLTRCCPAHTPGRLAVTFESFGFKYGPARDPDLMFDVRFLPNPHYEPTLRPLTGLDPSVVEFIDRDGSLDEFYDRLHPLLDYLLPQYLAEGKSHLVVAIGCTGGRHRSVAIAQHLAERYQQTPEYIVQVIHRDTERPA